MDRLTNSLNQQTGNAYHPSIIAAMKLARKKMDRYYSLTDASNAYRIAMVLHPGVKLEYFRNQDWEEEWIEQARSLVREEYCTKYEKESTSDEPVGEASTKGFLSFGDLSVTTRPRSNEIAEYLSHPVELVKDPLKWWTKNRNVYPNLHRMALDYLSIPGSLSYRVI
jgi:hAT family C-terminal dimerisation region